MRGYALNLVLAAFVASAAHAGDDTQDALCAEAEERYAELFGEASSETGARDGVHVVTMYKYNFCPRELTVKVGETVRWVNVDKRTSHSVIIDGESESDRAFPEEVIEFTFTVPGPPEEYLCGPHWERRGMIGSITVEE